MDRRAFLQRGSLAAGGLLLGVSAIDEYERLTHRKVWALGGLPSPRFMLSDTWDRTPIVPRYPSFFYVEPHILRAHLSGPARVR